MIGQSLPEYYFVRVCIAGLRLVAPASVAYLLTCAAARSILVSPVLGVVAVCEALFWVIFLLRRRRFNKATPPVPPRLSRSGRRELFEKCASQITDDYPSGWFLPPNSEIKRDNVHEWILWAMFASTPEHASPEWDEEIDEYVSVVEKTLGRKLDPGRAHGVKSLRLSFDPIHMLHRPLVWYTIVALVDTLTSVLLLSLGFKHYAPRRPAFRTFPSRPLLTLFSKSAATPHFPYWYRPPRAGGSKNPILFLHGIGIGLHPYVPLFREILRADPTQSLLLVEFLPVSMRITGPMPPRRTTLAAINTILEDLDIPKIVLAAHSYGTFLAAQILAPPPDAESTDDPALLLNRKVTALVLVDPIPFLLHLPAVAHNFLYRHPGARRANEWQLWYFASRDGDVARVLGRCFFWEEGCVWRADLDRFSAAGGGRRVTVVLGGGDQIVPSADVRAYLTGDADDDAREWAQAGGGAERWASRSGALEVLWFAGLDHATVFETKARRRLLMRALDPPGASYGSVDTAPSISSDGL
ncbi:hypothetical protein B0H17DRAFT_1157846 [Mycena rosella]|uniref:AB hydrolase-1 domain-containing protein n=1 Tax=Mycena rosella TaxID=1033263 RepID=A0AAD7DYD6_MYCRO|nr:hypothetical protein B0H17DRAFT_1157846 [Mycena rosella]